MKNYLRQKNKGLNFLHTCFVVLGSMVATVCGASSKVKLDVKVSKNLGKAQKAKYRVLITNHPAAFGEVQVVQRLTKAVTNLGWEWAIVECVDKQPQYVEQLKPNFIISLRAETAPVSGAVNLLYLHAPLFMYLNKDGVFAEKAYPNVLKYDGFLSVTPDVTPIRTAYETQHHKPFHNISTVFGVQHTKFNETPKTRLCHWGCIWDKARGSEAYQRLYHMLDATGYFDLYGHPKSWEPMKLTSYRGLIPSDDHSVVDKISECGLALVLHSHEHIKGGVPTSRIFEAAAASAVIICDEHPFVKENFGDAVLYIDPNQAPEKVFAQIDAHVKWVREHPVEALKLARKAYDIFAKRFTLEGELIKIAELYEKIAADQRQ